MDKTMLARMLMADPGNSSLQNLALEYLQNEQAEKSKLQMLQSLGIGGAAPTKKLGPPSILKQQATAVSKEPLTTEYEAKQPDTSLGAKALGLVKGFAAPMGQWAKITGEGLGALGHVATGTMKEQLGGYKDILTGKTSLKEGLNRPAEQMWKYGTESGAKEAYKPKLYSQEEWSKIEASPKEAITEGVKGGLGAASYIPMAMGGATAGSALGRIGQMGGRGLAAGMAGSSAVTKEELGSDKQLTDALNAGITTAIFAGGAQGIGEIASKVISKIQNRGISVNTPEARDKAFEKLFKSFKTKSTDFKKIGDPQAFKETARTAYDIMLDNKVQPKTEGEFFQILKNGSGSLSSSLDDIASATKPAPDVTTAFRDGWDDAASYIDDVTQKEIITKNPKLYTSVQNALSDKGTYKDLLDVKRYAYDMSATAGGAEKMFWQKVGTSAKEAVSKSADVSPVLSALDDTLTLTSTPAGFKGAAKPSNISVRPLGFGTSVNYRPTADALLSKTTPNLLGQQSPLAGGVSSLLQKGLGQAGLVGGMTTTGTQNQTPTLGVPPLQAPTEEAAIQETPAAGGFDKDLLTSLVLSGQIDATTAKFLMDMYATGGAEPMTTQQANAASGLASVDTMEQLWQQGGRGLLVAKSLPYGAFSSSAQTFDQASKDAIDVIARLRTGAVINEQEAKLYKSWIPKATDTDATIRYKIQKLRSLFESLKSGQSTTGEEFQGALGAM